MDKNALVRNHILDRLEAGTLGAGDRLPGAREIAAELSISFLTVQQALEGLCRDGILQTVSRRGTFVQAGWRERVLPENLSIFHSEAELPWLPGLRELIAGALPGVRFTHAFPVGALELKPTLHVQKYWAEYLDLSAILAECYPDDTDFFEQPFRGFRIGGKLAGVPFIFSPRVIYYNPEIFARAGCPLPCDYWTWDEFMQTVRLLRKTLPAERVINWHLQAFLWMNFVMRAGGRLIRTGAADPVEIDSPATRLGLRCFRELGRELGGKEYYETAGDFCKGAAAMMIADRQYRNKLAHAGFDGWRTVCFPAIPGGEEVTAQATDLLCVRKSCTNPELARAYIRLMLSPLVQDYIGRERYGIPIRKSAAFKSIDLADPRDALFAREIAHISAEYNLDSPHLADTVIAGVQQLLGSERDLDAGTAELAAFARQYLAIWRAAV